ncbi:MAG: polyphosphate kinase 1 [Limisphaerales bacterium]
MKQDASPKPETQHLINRDLSWLEFNQLILEEALDSSNPLLERVKFFCVFGDNLDRFFETRVAGLKQRSECPAPPGPDGLSAPETLRAVNRRVRQMVKRQYACWREHLRPALAGEGISILDWKDLGKAEAKWVDDFYHRQVRPVLTPLGLDPAHPFPKLLNKSLNMILQLEVKDGEERRKRLAVVQVPRVLPRLVKLPRDDPKEQSYLFLGEIIGRYLGDLFPEATVAGYWFFRVTRNGELYADEEEVAAALDGVELELRQRRRGEAVRLEIAEGCPVEMRSFLLEQLHLGEDDLFMIDGPVNPVRLLALAEEGHSPELRYPPFLAPAAAALRNEPDIFAAIRHGDILLHHPYDSFNGVADFLRQASSDPKVLAIKQTLYHAGGDSQIVSALMDAVRNGKQVTVVLELKGRSSEGKHLLWARQLEEAGVHVLYGLVGCKVHAKMCLVVRKDDDAIRRYLHLSTGNYDPAAARLNTDLALLTCRPDFGEDATNLFNLLTGICQFPGAVKLVVAPFDLHRRTLALIERETANAQNSLPARIIAKMNNLEDARIIDALYRASQAGVKIDLLVRGVCCLRPQVAGLSENITVRCIVDRYVEHSRIFCFENACQPEIWLSSADWTPKHCFHRIEVAFPIEDGNLRERLRSGVLETLLSDNVKARFLQANGTYARPPRRRGMALRRGQMEFLQTASEQPGMASTDGQTAAPYPRFKLAPSPFSAKDK